MKKVFLLVGLLTLVQWPAQRVQADAVAQVWTVTSVSATSTLDGWPTSRLNDGNVDTQWSSSKHNDAELDPIYPEAVSYWFDGHHDVNYIKFYPRYDNGDTFGFPTTFTIKYSDGANWQPLYTFTSFPTPTTDWIILPFGQTVDADGLQISATTLGADDYGDYYFQLGEVGGGYDPGFDVLKYVGQTAPAGYNVINNIGADQFNPNKISNWNYDYRLPLLKSTCPESRNIIYAPKAVWNEASQQWYLYYGGNDAVADSPCDVVHDRIYYLPTDKDFQTLNEADSRLIINQGSFRNANNPAIARAADGTLAMIYTAGWCPEEYPDEEVNCAAYGDERNLPAYATSSDGVTWSPNNPGDPFGSNALITIDNYHRDWNAVDTNINGENALLYDNRQFWYYYAVEWLGYRANSNDLVNFSETGSIYDGPRYENGADNFATNKAINDIAHYRYNGKDYYLFLSHHNEAHIYYSISNDPSWFPDEQILFSNTSLVEGAPGAGDDRMVGVGLVTDGTTLYGALYGGHDEADVYVDWNTALFAIWLQKKVLFTRTADGVRWGEIERGQGPNKLRLAMGDETIANGVFTIYDTDGTTLLYTSPPVTMISGMEWNYQPDNDCLPPATGDWIITNDCIITKIVTAPGSVIVNNNATLTINADAALDVDFKNYSLKIENGSTVIVNHTATLN